MATAFVVEDAIHGEWMGEFSDRGSAIALLERLKANPSATENRPPCRSWRTCRREYYLLVYDDTTTPSTLLSSEPAFAVALGEVQAITAPRR